MLTTRILGVNIVFNFVVIFWKFKWCKDWKTGWHFFHRTNKREWSKCEKKLSLLKTKIETIDERFAIGEIESDIYTKFKTKYKKDQKDLKSNLLNSTISSSNRKSKYYFLHNTFTVKEFS